MQFWPVAGQTICYFIFRVSVCSIRSNTSSLAPAVLFFFWGEIIWEIPVLFLDDRSPVMKGFMPSFFLVFGFLSRVFICKYDDKFNKSRRHERSSPASHNSPPFVICHWMSQKSSTRLNSTPSAMQHVRRDEFLFVWSGLSDFPVWLSRWTSTTSLLSIDDTSRSKLFSDISIKMASPTWITQ